MEIIAGTKLSRLLQEIIEVQETNRSQRIASLRSPVSPKSIREIESNLGHRLPTYLTKLYNFADGQNKDGSGLLLDYCFLTSNDIKEYQLLANNRWIKLHTKLTKQEINNYLIKTFVKQQLENKLTVEALEANFPTWQKIKYYFDNDFESAADVFYKTPKGVIKRSLLNEEFVESKEIQILQTHEFESIKYNSLSITIFKNKRIHVERLCHLDEYNTQQSTEPNNTIESIFLSPKWLPIFSNYQGKYIAIDFNPKTGGRKEQVILTESDLNKITKISESLETFFEHLLELIKRDIKNIKQLTLNDLISEIKCT